MENNLDFTVAMLVIVGALLFSVIFFGQAVVRDFISWRRRRVLENNTIRTQHAIAYSAYDSALTIDAFQRHLTNPQRDTLSSVKAFDRASKRHNEFEAGDYAYCNGLPVYNDLADEYNRKYA